MNGPHRLPGGGLIDRTRPRAFTFDGQAFSGFAGDTLAAALMANGVKLVARSFKYHRPRGILTAGSEEPNALFELRTGARREPNTRATTAELYDGLVATRADAMKQTLAAVRDTMTKFAAEGPTLQELTDAKTYLTGSYPRAFSSNQGIAAQLNAFQRAGLPVDYVAKRNDMINAITIEDVRRAAKRLFDPKRLTIVVAGTLKDAKKR